MEWCPLGKGEDDRRRGDEEPEEQRRPAQGDERPQQREGDHGRAHVLPASPAESADQRRDDLRERNSDVRLGPTGKTGVDPARKIGPGIRLETDQERGRIETKPEQEDAATDPDQTDQTLAW